MQVQSIQTTNDFKNQNFKAKFIYDSAGNFRDLWINSTRSSNFNQVADTFSKIRNGEYEIVSKMQNANYYTIFNRRTKSNDFVYIPEKEQYKLEYLMNNIINNHSSSDTSFDKTVEGSDNNSYQKFVNDRYGHKTDKNADNKLYQRFINDRYGYLNEVLTSPKSPDYIKNIEKFVSSTNAILEIYDKDVYTPQAPEISAFSGKQSHLEPGITYSIINRKTGTHQSIFLGESIENKLEYLIKQITTDCCLLNSNEETKVYSKLLGIG